MISFVFFLHFFSIMIKKHCANCHPVTSLILFSSQHLCERGFVSITEWWTPWSRVSRLGICSPVVTRETSCRYPGSWRLLIPTRSNRIRSTVSMIWPLTTVLSFFPVCCMENYFRKKKKKNQNRVLNLSVTKALPSFSGNIVILLCCFALKGIAFLDSCLFFFLKKSIEEAVGQLFLCIWFPSTFTLWPGS